MSHRRCYQFLVVIFLAIHAFTATINAQPSLVPPVAIGPQTLSFGTGVHEFLTQESFPLKGDIRDIIAPPNEYWVYIVGIDATDLTGSAGRRVRFHLQDFEDGSSFKHLGISFSLSNPLVGGGDLLDCFQGPGQEGQSTHGLFQGELTANTFDLRFQFTKIESEDPWTVTPSFRLSGDEGWTIFEDGAFITTQAFNFVGAKLVVIFDNGAGGTVSFDNFFVVGPITNFTGIFVDDDWSELPNGEVVQFPGQFNVQVIGENAFDTIQEGINKIGEEFFFTPVNSTRVNSVTANPPLSTVLVAPGTYQENLELFFPLRIVGAGSGTDDASNTIIDGDSSTVISIDESASGFSEIERLALRNLRVTGGVPGSGNGIFITSIPQNPIANFKNSRTNFLNSVVTKVVYMTFENVSSIDNVNGINIQHNGDVKDIEVKNCLLSGNDFVGFYVAAGVQSLSDLRFIDGEISNNNLFGLAIDPNNSPGSITNINITGTNFINNGTAVLSNVTSSVALKTDSPSINQNGSTGDIVLSAFNGDATFTNVSITGGGGLSGVQMFGANPDGFLSAGTVTFDSLLIDGTYFGAGMMIGDYTDVDSISFTDVELDVSQSLINNVVASPPATSTALAKTSLIPIIPASNLFLEQISGTLNIGNTAFGDDGTALYDILNFSSGAVDADSATFVGAEDNFAIEDRVVHAIDIGVLMPNPIQSLNNNSPQLKEIPIGFGLVTWVPDNVFMTTNSYFMPFTPFPSIQRAIDAASPADTLNIAPGDTYSDAPNIYIFKDLVIIGSGPEQTVLNSGGNTGTIILDPGWFVVGDTAEVHVHDMTFDGGEGNQTFYAFHVLGAASFTNVHFNDIYYTGFEGTAIAALGGLVNVTSCTFTDIGRAGVLYSGEGVNGSLYNHNTYIGKGDGGGEEEYIDYAVVADGGAHVTIDSSSVSNNNGILFGKGTELSAGYLVRDSNANVTIKNSEISNSIHGIRVESGEGSPTAIITGNNIYSCDIGVEIESALFVRIEKNNITENGTGLNLNNITTTFDVDLNSILSNFNYGVRITNADGEMNDNIISGNDTGVKIREGAAGTVINGNEFCDNTTFAVRNITGIVVDATGNWWGSDDGPSRSGTPTEGDSVTTDVDFDPFKSGSLFPESPCASGCITNSEVEGNGDVNGDSFITAGDALCAFNIFLNGGSLPDACDAAEFQCETLAANVDCDVSTTPQDALDIFQRFLDQDPPSNCFAGGAPLTKPAAANIYTLSFVQSGVVENNQIKIGLRVDNPEHLSAFGLDVNYPTDKLHYIGIERAAVTAEWTQLDANELEDGRVRVGGFHVETVASMAAGELFRLIFEVESDAVGLNEIAMSEIVDDLQNAIIAAPGEEVITSVPATFALHQNFPNPFNPDTRIRFDIPKLSEDGVLVTIKIYNIKGELVRTVLNEKRAAGSHSILWDGKNDLGQPPSSGAYFYTITAGSFKESKRMIMVK